jgi:NitT/TauT family transport system substrate-binding protein
MPRKHVSVAARLLAAAACALLAATPAAPARANDTLVILGGSLNVTLFDTQDAVAQGAGFYAGQHLDIVKQFTGTASNCTQLLALGKGDICGSGMEPIIVGYDKGVRAQFFFNRDPRYDYVTAVLGDSPIRTLADFKGKNLGEYNVGSASEIATNTLLAGAGLRKGDYTFTPVGGGAQALLALTTKKIDGVSFPDAELAVDTVVGNVTFRVWRDPLIDDVPNVGYMSSPATIQTKGDLLRRYARAMAEAALFIRYNPVASARYWLEEAHQRVTPEAIRTVAAEIASFQGDFPAADPANKRIGAFPLRGIQLYCRYLYNAGLTKDIVPAGAIVTNQFVPFANDFDHQAVIAMAKAAR